MATQQQQEPQLPFFGGAGAIPSSSSSTPLFDASVQAVRRPSSSSSSSAFVLDPDAVLRRASSIAGCQYLAAPAKKNTASTSSASTTQPNPTSYFPGVSVRRAAFQQQTTSTSTGSSSSGSGSFNSSGHAAASQQQQEQPTRVLSFLVPSPDDVEKKGQGGTSGGGDVASSSSLPVKVTVFVDTGTVCISHILHGQIRHVFRRNVTTLDAVERLLRYPPSMTPVDQTIVGLDDDDDESDESDDDDESDNDNEGAPVTVKNPIRVLQSELELAHVGVAILEAEKSKLEHHLQSLVEQQQQQRNIDVVAADPTVTAAVQVVPAYSPPPAPIPTAAPKTVSTGGFATGTAVGAVAAPSTTTTKAATATQSTGTTNLPSFAASKASLVAAAASALKGPPAAPKTTAGTSPAVVAASTTAKAPPVPPPAPTRKWDPPAPLPASGAASLSGSASVGSGTAASASVAAASAAPVVSKDIGMEFQFSLSASSMKHVDQCMSDITGMNKLIRGVATNGRGTVFLYGNGGVAYTPNIPRPLHHKLSQLRSNTKMSSRPSYVSLGSKDRFYCAFHDGTYCVRGPKSLEKELKKCFTAAASAAASSSVSSFPSMLSQATSHHHHPSSLLLTPVSVAFGSNWEAWFIVFGDGSWKFQGKIPIDLSNKLASRKDRGDLVRVTLGPSGEWFVKARNGRMWWGGLTDAADESIQRLLKDHELCFLDFGEDGSYFVSYD